MACLEFTELSVELQSLARAFVEGVRKALGPNLHGVYMYGAAVFAESEGTADFDCHVLVEAPPSQVQRDLVQALHEQLARDFPPLGSELDVYYILRRDAEEPVPPTHVLHPEIRDDAWALHCAHVRAGYFICLDGPSPTQIFPEPSWEAVVSALQSSFRFVERELHAPAYCALNLARILYSHLHRDPVLSKRRAGLWAREQYPRWAPLMNAALLQYAGRATDADADLLHSEIRAFLAFARSAIEDAQRAA